MHGSRRCRNHAKAGPLLPTHAPEFYHGAQEPSQYTEPGMGAKQSLWSAQ